MANFACGFARSDQSFGSQLDQMNLKYMGYKDIDEIVSHLDPMYSFLIAGEA